MKVIELLENDIDSLFREQKARTHEFEIYIDRILKKYKNLKWEEGYDEINDEDTSTGSYLLTTANTWWSTNTKDMKRLFQQLEQELHSLPEQELKLFKHKYNLALQAKQKYEEAGGRLFSGDF